MSQDKFVVCSNCRRHGHITIEGQELPEVIAQRAAMLQLLALIESNRVDAVTARRLFNEIDNSPLPKTEQEAMVAALTDGGQISQLIILGMAMEMANSRPSEIAKHAGAFPG